jgi:hypothetical protein
MNRSVAIHAALALALAILPSCDPPEESEQVTDHARQNLWELATPGGEQLNVAEPGRWTRVATSLDSWTPMLVDGSGDGTNGESAHDIRHVLLVMTETDVLVRYKFGSDVTSADRYDLRFWLEQGDKFLTVETKSRSSEQECAITVVGQPDQSTVPACFEATGDRVDIAIPRTQMPTAIDLGAEFWLSGPQVCCSDAARAEPIDKLDASQVVWRVPAAQ